MKKLCTAILIGLTFSVATAASAEDAYTLSLTGKKFVPEELSIPAGKKVKLTVKNTNAAPMEFESYELNREKIISGNAETVIFIGPLEPGKYTFFDEFQPKTTGVIIAK